MSTYVPAVNVKSLALNFRHVWRNSGYPSVRSAAEDATKKMEKRRISTTLEANRRLLRKLLTADLRSMGGMQEAVYNRAVLLLQYIAKDESRVIDVKPFDSTRLLAWRWTHEHNKWMEPPSPKEAAKILRDLDDDFADRLRRAVEGFRSTSQERGHDPRRIDYAIARFLAPFCASERTYGIERHWNELTKKERETIISCGLAIEKAWLGSHPSHERVYRQAGDVVPLLTDFTWPTGPVYDPRSELAATDDDTHTKPS